MMTAKIEITGADIYEVDGICPPDYPIVFEADNIGDVSLDSVAQSKGAELWERMHGEKASHVYYTAEYL
jgi:hypothetical protein